MNKLIVGGDGGVGGVGEGGAGANGVWFGGCSNPKAQITEHQFNPTGVACRQNEETLTLPTMSRKENRNRSRSRCRCRCLTDQRHFLGSGWASPKQSALFYAEP